MVNYNIAERLPNHINWNFTEVANCCPKGEMYFACICAAESQNHRNIYIISLTVLPFQHGQTVIFLKNVLKIYVLFFL